MGLSKLLLRSLGLLLAVSAAFTPQVAQSAFVQYTFTGDIIAGSYNAPGCPGLCSPQFVVPPAGNPITIVVGFDTNSPGVPGAGNSALYELTAPAFVDFGYGPDWRFTDFKVGVVNDLLASSRPDQLFIRRDAVQGVPNIYFSIELGSPNSTFLSGLGLPSTLSFDSTTYSLGTLSRIGATSTTEYSLFTLSAVQVSAVPEPSSFLMFISGIVAMSAFAWAKSTKNPRPSSFGVSHP